MCTVRDIKKIIQNKFDILIVDLIIIFNNRLLNDENNLSYYDIKE